MTAGGRLQLTENAAGQINVTQASVSAVSAANSGAAVTETGSPTYAATAPASPVTPSLPLLALRGEAVAGEAEALALDALQVLAEAAIARWVDAGIDAAQQALLESVAFGVADLKGSILGLATTGLVLVDTNAAGWDWFVDATPMLDEEFGLLAPVGDAGARIDLLTVLVHELGHVLGLADQHAVDGVNVMAGYLDVGHRLVPDVQLVGVAPALFDEVA